MRLLVKRLSELAVLPTYAHDGDSGLDLSSIDKGVLQPREWRMFRTGIAIELPESCEAQIRPRSGLALKKGVTVLNSPGTIDASFRGELGVVLVNLGTEEFIVDVGMKIAQLVVMPVYRVEVEEAKKLTETRRGGQGFGSTSR